MNGDRRIPIENVAARSQEESRIAVRWLRRLESVLADRDPSVCDAALAAAGLSPAALNGACLVNLDQLRTAQLFARKRYPDITLRMYQAADLLDVGLLGYALASSGTIRRAFEVAIRYHDATTNRYQLEMLFEAPDVIIRLVPFLEHIHEYQDMGEELSGLVKIIETLISDQVEMGLVRAAFAYPVPDYVDVYTEVFPGPCRFQSSHCEVTFPARWMDLPVTAANPRVAEVCAEMCEKVLGVSSGDPNSCEEVKRLLVSRVGGEIPTLEAAADALQLSVNQLRKRLYREKTSYKEVVLEVRMTLARHYLQATNQSVQDIAYLLDYSQAAPFSRAFKAYYGVPPRQMRAA